MRPKFEVGEVVILQSRTRPDCSGEFIVVQVNQYPCGTRFEFEESWYRHPDDIEISYFLNDPFKSSHDSNAKACWAESSLRKKHQPGELNFRELMSSLSSPKLITHHS